MSDYVIHKGTLMIVGHGAAIISLTRPDPKVDGRVVLEAGWKQTRGNRVQCLSILPCPRSIERWSDGGWRVFGEQRPVYQNPIQAAIDFVTRYVNDGPTTRPWVEQAERARASVEAGS